MQSSIELDGDHDERRCEGTLRNPVDGAGGGAFVTAGGGHAQTVGEQAQRLFLRNRIHRAVSSELDTPVRRTRLEQRRSLTRAQRTRLLQS